MTAAPSRGYAFWIAALLALDAFDEFDQAHVQTFVTFFEREFNPEGF